VTVRLCAQRGIDAPESAAPVFERVSGCWLRNHSAACAQPGLHDTDNAIVLFDLMRSLLHSGQLRALGQKVLTLADVFSGA